MKLVPNAKFKAILATYDISQTEVALWINKSKVAVGQKIKEYGFNQREMKIIVEKLSVYNQDIDMNIFL